MAKKSNLPERKKKTSPRIRTHTNTNTNKRTRTRTKITSNPVQIEVKNGAQTDKSRGRFLVIFALVLSLPIGIGIGVSIGVGIGSGLGEQKSTSIVESAIDELVRSAPNEVNRGVLERAAIEGALKATGDQWANYFPSSTIAKLEDRNANVLTGIGVTLRKTKSGAIEIAQVINGTTAESAGLKNADQIVEVSGTDVQGASLTTVAALIIGEIGQNLKLRVIRGAEKLDFIVTTEKVNLKTVEGSQLDKSVAYIAISNFAIGTSIEVREAIGKLDLSGGVILDLRDNPGGLVEEAVRVAELFIGNGAIVSYKVAGEEKVFRANNSSPVPSPLVIMTNRGTSSSAELLAAAIQDRNRGVVIGERTYGKGSVQDFITLEDGSKLELTIALYLTPSGRTIEGVGVTPDLVVKKSELNVKALQILGGLSQLNNPTKKS
jgi:carboxyl-terminal processing protease